MVKARPASLFCDVAPSHVGPHWSRVSAGNSSNLLDGHIPLALYCRQCLSGRLLHWMSLSRQVLSGGIRYIPWKSSGGYGVQGPNFHPKVLPNQCKSGRDLPRSNSSVSNLLACNNELGLHCCFLASGDATRYHILPCHVHQV